MSPELERLHFDVHPSVVLQLGDQLISDDVQALIELVKNAYDADSAYATVRVEPDYVMSEKESFFPGAVGRIVIEDGGTGMDRTTIQRGWLTVSNSPKREMKQKGERTKKKRTPLGDKGLGRLGVQRLGRYVELFTCEETGTTGHHVGIDWARFHEVDALTAVPVPAKPISKRTGTQVVVSGLLDTEGWKLERTYRDVRRKLSQLIFPFGQERPFRVSGTVCGRPLELETLADEVRETATIHYDFDFDGEVLIVRGKYRMNYLQSRDLDEYGDDDNYSRLIESDNGASFFAYLSRGKKAGRLTYTGSDGWFVSTEVRQRFVSVDKVELVNDVVANPGPFSGEIDYFNLTQRASLNSVFDKVAQFSDFVKSQSGIRVFRDGFGIRPYGFEGNDWLGLGAQQTSGSSFYGLRPANTIGFVRLSGTDNKELQELTNREGFVENPYYLNFYRLMGEVVNHIRLVNTQLRRGYNEFKREQLETGPNVAQKSSVDRVVKGMKAASAKARGLAAKVSQTQQVVSNLQQKTKEVQQQAEDISGGNVPGMSMPATDPSLTKFLGLLEEVHKALNQSRQTLHAVSLSLDELQQIEQASDAMEYDYRMLREQLVQFSELAGLGLTAEALSHELLRVAQDLHERTLAITMHLRSNKIADVSILTFIENVRGAISGLRKQIAHLDPAMHYVREQREVLSVRQFLDEFADYYRDRLNRSEITVQVLQETPSFWIKVNRGRLTQILDNLILNAEYWLKESLRKGITSKGDIKLVIRSPFVQVLDTGEGVDPIVEHSLFDPFITRKPKGEGRGLGLFIVRQLLDSVNCKVSLLPVRNQHDRRYIFQLDLSGVCADEPR